MPTLFRIHRVSVVISVGAAVLATCTSTYAKNSQDRKSGQNSGYCPITKKLSPTLNLNNEMEKALRSMLSENQTEFDKLNDSEYEQQIKEMMKESEAMRTKLAQISYANAKNHSTQLCVRAVKTAMNQTGYCAPPSANSPEMDEQLPSYGFLRYRTDPVSGLPIGPKRDGSFGVWTSLKDAPPGVAVTYRGRTAEEEQDDPFFSKNHSLKVTEKLNAGVTHAELWGPKEPAKAAPNSDFRQSGAVTGTTGPRIASGKMWVFSAAWFPGPTATRKAQVAVRTTLETTFFQKLIVQML